MSTDNQDANVAVAAPAVAEPAVATAAAPAAPAAAAAAEPAQPANGADKSDEAAMKDVAEGAAESEEAEEAEEAEAAPKKKGRKPRASAAADDAGSAAAAAAAAPSTGVSQRGRERKAVQSFVPPTPTKLAKEEFVIEDGQGTPLGDIENIKRRMDTINAQDDILKACFLACYPTWKGRGGNTKDVIKKNLRAFSGYVKGQEKELAEKATERLERYHGDVLKHVCALLDISESGSKAKMIEHITTFLQNPKSSGHAYKGGSVGTKRKSASITKKGGKADDSTKKKRGPTAYFIFQAEVRDKVRTEHPDLKTAEVAKKIGELWHALSESKKDQYKARAKAGDAAAAGASGSDEEEEEEEEEEEKPKAKKPKVAKKTDKSAAAAAAAVPELAAEWKEKLTTSIDAQLKDADLTTLSMREVLKLLSEEHGLVVEANELAVKTLVKERIQHKTTV